MNETKSVTRILLIEDDDIDREAITRFVRRQRLAYDLTVADSKEKALEILANQTFDVILLDYNLGTATGLEIIPYTGKCPVVFVTGSGSEEIAADAMRHGAYDYLIKDPERNYLKVLQASICNVLKRKEIEREKDRLIRELRIALAEVKTLRGFIPICANCKKIRNDEGFWEQIEKYVQEHSEAKFSHGICPGCVKQLYPEMYEKMEKNIRSDVPDAS